MNLYEIDLAIEQAFSDAVDPETGGTEREKRKVPKEG